MFGRPRLTTLHDYSGQRWQIRLGMSVFTIGGRLVVTGALDRDALVGRHPWLASRVNVIPIGSNVPGGLWEPSGPFTIVHFGMLRPAKGIEQMIHLATLCKQLGRPYRTVIMGAVVPHGRDYAETLFKMAEGSGVEWMLNVRQERASEVLRHAHVAYLSPPFGVHERRGTVLACAANGLPIVAKVEWETPAFLRDHVIAAASPQEALAAVDELAGAGTGPARMREQSARSVALAQMFSWDTIADRYIEAMEAATSPGVRPGTDAGEVAGTKVEISVR
jgi:glycosyltransferase involved in cell wall biosynthesis